ncbi:MotA/TolQ/ExbB proton channel family protein [Laribacter hongkongensis]|uniref:MotA/TolQ/ExbB proton channel family protein n=1 Tax=Laribacter hongkongensis TaxID=168471 RepID=UPI001EFCD27F|nr:MotA/TolQ/ExbB proton channel family protein [Laribacter hongkongensis]MCG9124140.1 MotA/TolQ/ExbB proton channel family protein [Laribacter hongkongensis]
MTSDAISEMLTNPVNIIFTAAIVWAFLHGKKSIEKGTHKNFVEYAPTLMTSLGLFGTFTGIFLGLIGFDTAHIDTSIGTLLDGLKTAFFTSIVGMAVSIAFKFLHIRATDKPQQIEETVAGEAGPNEIYAVMKQQQQAMDLLVQAIGGSGDRSLVGQVQLMRADLNDFRSGLNRQHEAFEDKLWGQLQNFAEMLSKSATEQVIEALKQVIVEFNQRLTEQFGDNFKRLDESVKKLVDWQQLYMQQLEEMIEQYKLGVQSIDSTREAVQEIRVETAKIPVHMESLGEVVHVNQHQIAELTRHLEAFGQMRDKAVIAVPEIQQKLEDVADYLRTGADQINLELVRGADEYKASVQETGVAMRNIGHELAEHSSGISKELQDAFTLLALNTERIRNGITSTISTSMEAVETSSKQTAEATAAAVTSMLDKAQSGIDTSNQAYAQHMSRSLESLETHAKDMLSKTNEGVNKQINKFNGAMENELNKALTDLGSALATIHQHLVKEVYKGQLKDRNVNSF